MTHGSLPFIWYGKASATEGSLTRYAKYHKFIQNKSLIGYDTLGIHWHNKKKATKAVLARLDHALANHQWIINT